MQTSMNISDLSKDEISVMYITPALHRAERDEDSQESVLHHRTHHCAAQATMSIRQRSQYSKTTLPGGLNQEIQEVKSMLGLVAADKT